MIHFVFPKDLMTPTRPDPMFAEQFTALQDAGFSASLASVANPASARVLVKVPAESEVVYRGWMLKKQEYAALVQGIEQCGASAFTGTQQYLAAHHLPNWYPLIAEITPETRVYPANADIERELRALNWGAYFLKDYVKSLKTARGSIVRDPADAPAVLAEMLEYRSEIEGGICVRRVEDFIPETERRYFVLNGVAYATSATTPIPDVVTLCCDRVPSRFFSVDVVQRRDGQVRVVEIGDGQVSDVVGWSVDAFVEIWTRYRTSSNCATERVRN